MPEETPAAPQVSVVVPVRDGAAQLPALLDALGAQADAPPFEVVVVDNGSRDSTAAIAERHPVVRLVVREPRPGSYAARNAGVAAASAPALAFTDADCTPCPTWLAAGTAALQGAHLVGGAIEQRRSARPTVWEVYDRATYLDQAELVTTQRFAATANLFVRREVFDAVGLFDAALRSSGDLEFGHRAAAAGFALAFSPEARVAHQPRSTLAGTWRLHRRLGAGWAALARRGLRPPAWRDQAMRMPLDWVQHAVAQRGERLRRRALLPVHAVVLAARWTGWAWGWLREGRRAPTARSGEGHGR